MRCDMKLIEILRRIYYMLIYYYQKFQFIVLSIVVVGIVDYFFLYEILVSLMPLMSILALEIAPVFIIILSIIIIRGIIKFIRKKVKENKHYQFV
jgi:hypothetical protein